MAEETGIVLTSTGESDKTFVVPSMAYSIGATGLTPDTTYNVTAYYTNAKGSTIYTPQATEFKTLPEVKDDWFYLENVDSVAGTLTFENMGGKNLEYSTDGTNWTTAVLTTTFTLNVNAGEKVYLRGDNTVLWSSRIEKHISADFNHIIGGNIISLLDKVNYTTITSITNQYAFGSLFYHDTKLISAGDVNFGNVTTLGDSACYSMYRDCTALTTPPDLSNVQTLGSEALSGAFWDCHSLSTAPDLSSVTSLGYSALSLAFEGCTALTTPPDLSNVTTLGDYALHFAFRNCTALATAPDLSSVTSLGYYALSHAFEGCTALTTPPDLSNVTTLGDYALYYAFINCTSLTTAPDLSSVTSLGVYALYTAFQGCTSLATASGLSNVTSLGEYALAYAFQGCTALTTPPDLSNVTTLGNHALSSVFDGCTSLTTAPDLSNVQTLGEYAVSTAFRGCTKLQTVYVPNVDTWSTSVFALWVKNAGTSVPSADRVMYAPKQLLGIIPSGDSGYGNYKLFEYPE